MANKDILKKISKALSPEKAESAFKSFDERYLEFRKQIEKDIKADTLDDVNTQISKLKKRMDVTPLVESVKEIEQTFKDTISNLGEVLIERENELKRLIDESQSISDVRSKDIEGKIKTTETSFDSVIKAKQLEIDGILMQISDLETAHSQIGNSIKDIESRINSVSAQSSTDIKSTLKKITELKDSFDESRKDLLERIGKHGGGNANRQINVKSSVMSSKYTDINFQNSTSIGWTATDDDVNKRVNITASVLLSGGGGAGNPGGNNTEVQYNDNGSFGASSTFTWNKNTSVLSVGEGIMTGHAFRGDASDGGFLQNNAGKDIVSFGPGNSGNMTVYGPTNFSSTISVGSSASIKGVLTMGLQGSVVGIVSFHAGSSGRVRVQAPSVATTYTLTLPANDGNAGQYLLTDGNGITQWASVVATGGSGITRTTSIISDNTTGGTTANTDYVYVATVGLAFTLPDANGNANLYTLKNATNSSVLVTAVGGDTIDGSGSVLVAINNQSLDFISDNSNWRII